MSFHVTPIDSLPFPIADGQRAQVRYKEILAIDNEHPEPMMEMAACSPDCEDDGEYGEEMMFRLLEKELEPWPQWLNLPIVHTWHVQADGVA